MASDQSGELIDANKVDVDSYEVDILRGDAQEVWQTIEELAKDLEVFGRPDHAAAMIKVGHNLVKQFLPNNEPTDPLASQVIDD